MQMKAALNFMSKKAKKSHAAMGESTLLRFCRPVCRCFLERSVSHFEADRVLEAQPQSRLITASLVSYPFTSNSFVAVERPFKDTSTLYVPAGQPSGFAMWNSVAAGPVGAMVWVDSFTTCPSW
jgi:hypothetical protein